MTEQPFTFQWLWAFRDHGPDIPGFVHRVALVLVSIIGKDHKSPPKSQRELAGQAGVSVRSLQRAIAWMREANMLATSEAYRGGVLVYSLHPPCDWAVATLRQGRRDPTTPLSPPYDRPVAPSRQPSRNPTTPQSYKRTTRELQENAGRESDGARPGGHGFDSPPEAPAGRPALSQAEEHTTLQAHTSPDIDDEVEAVVEVLKASPVARAFQGSLDATASKLLQVFRDRAGTLEMSTGRPIPLEALTDKLEAKLFALDPDLKVEAVRLQALKAARYAAGDWHRHQGKGQAPSAPSGPVWRPPVPQPGPDPLARILDGVTRSAEPVNDADMEASIAACLEAWTL